MKVYIVDEAKMKVINRYIGYLPDKHPPIKPAIINGFMTVRYHTLNHFAELLFDETYSCIPPEFKEVMDTSEITEYYLLNFRERE